MFVAMAKNVIVNRLGATKIYAATNGEDALRILDTKKIDIVIADWELRKMSGDELLRKMRSDERFKDIPFVMMSANGGKEFVVEAVQSGANQFVVKPFSPEKLEDAIRKAWNSAQKRAARRYSGLPDHSLSIQLNDNVVNAQVQNVSRTGMLLSMVYDDGMKLFGEYEMGLEFNDIDDVGIIDISPLPARIVRMEAAASFHPSTLKCEVALAFAAEKFDAETKENLTKLFTFLKDKEKTASKPSAD